MNSTGNDTSHHSDTATVFNAISQCLILICTVIGNSILILSLHLQTEGFRLVDKLILNTSICNVLVVIISIPIELVAHFYQYPFSNFVCKFIDPVTTYLFNACGFTYVAIAFERWILVSSINYRPPTKVHTLIVFLAIHGCAFFSVIPYMPVLEVKDEEGKIVCCETWEISSRKSYTLSLFLIQYGVPVPLLIVFYAKTWFIVYKSYKKLVSMLHSSIKTIMNETSIGVPAASSVNNSSNNPGRAPGNRNWTKEKDRMDRRTDPSRSFLPPNHMLQKKMGQLHPMTAPPTFSCGPTETYNAASFPTQLTSKTKSALYLSSSDGAIPERSKPFLPKSVSFDLYSSDVEKSRGDSDAFIGRISRYFSLSGDVSFKECQQITALKRREKQTRNLLIRFTIITSVFIVCMLPNQVHWLIIDFVENGNECFSEMTRMLIHLITYTNGVVNPLLHVYYDKHFCTKLAMILKKVWSISYKRSVSAE